MEPNSSVGPDQHDGTARILPQFPTVARVPPGQAPPHAPSPSMLSGQSYYGYSHGIPPPPANGYESQISQRYPPYHPPYPIANEQQRAGGPFGPQISSKSHSGAYEPTNGPYYPQGSFDGPHTSGVISRANFDRNATAPLPQREVLRTNSSGSSGSSSSAAAAAVRAVYPPASRSYSRGAPALVNKYGHHPGSGAGITLPLPPPPLRPTGPYTTAQLESMPRGPGKTLGKQLEVEKAQAARQNEPNSMSDQIQQRKGQHTKSSAHLDPDERAYTVITGRSGATSPSQIDSFRREDVVTMGCTCKKSKCLKLYCMCFGASVVCGQNCRCVVCHNTPNHEQVRKDAIRNILARNPNAFDTKFKKTEKEEVEEELAAVASGPSRAITHKLGCKCRKSFCTKKYCECYNAGVKCSGSCRCVSCKNIPVGGVVSREDDPPKGSAFSISMAASKNNKLLPVVLRKTGEPWMVNSAAQNLAFLRHASPAKPDRKTVRQLSGGRENSMASLPSLTASETSISPTEQEADGVNSLLMAAYAMTELFAQDAPAMAGGGTPEKQRIEGKEFRSPKRKTLESRKPARFSDVETHPNIKSVEESVSAVATPITARKMKRTRVGTVEKARPSSSLAAESSFLCEERLDSALRSENLSDGEASEDEVSSPSEGIDDTVTPVKPFATPQGTKDIINVMTPVTARCIDFQHMGVTDESDSMVAEEKKESETDMGTDQLKKIAY